MLTNVNKYYQILTNVNLNKYPQVAANNNKGKTVNKCQQMCTNVLSNVNKFWYMLTNLCKWMKNVNKYIHQTNSELILIQSKKIVANASKYKQIQTLNYSKKLQQKLAINPSLGGGLRILNQVGGQLAHWRKSTI